MHLGWRLIDLLAYLFIKEVIEMEWSIIFNYCRLFNCN